MYSRLLKFQDRHFSYWTWSYCAYCDYLDCPKTGRGNAKSSTQCFVLTGFCPLLLRSQKFFLLVLIIPFRAENPVGEHPGDTIYAYCGCIFGEKWIWQQYKSSNIEAILRLISILIYANEKVWEASDMWHFYLPTTLRLKHREQLCAESVYDTSNTELFNKQKTETELWHIKH